MSARESIERLFIGITGASLSVNAWLLASKINDINDTLTKISDKLSEVREDEAAVKAEVMAHTAEIARLQYQHERHSHEDKDHG